MVEVANPQPLSCDRTHDCVRVQARRLVEEPPDCQFAIQCFDEFHVGGDDIEASRLAFGDELVAEDVGVDFPNSAGVRHCRYSRDRRWRSVGKFGIAGPEPGSGLDCQQVRAKTRYLVEQCRLRGLGQSEDPNKRCDSDRDSERGQCGPRLSRSRA